MPRSKRFLLPESCYHIITRGNNQNIIFKSGSDYLYFLNLALRYKAKHPFDIYHYCLMPNHVHFLIKTQKARDFSAFMQKLNLSYFHYYKRKYGWTGHFWQNRYKNQPVGKDSYFIQCGKYIELNPVRANIVRKPEEYQYSSYNYYAKGKADQLITPNFIYREMNKNSAEKQMQYQQLFIDQVIQGSYNKKAWGSGRQRHAEQQKINRKIKRA